MSVHDVGCRLVGGAAFSKSFYVWKIVITFQPVVLNGDRNRPRLIFSNLIGTECDLHTLRLNRQCGESRSSYKNEKLKHIEGFDKSTNENNTTFLWKGSGILAAFKSRWEIIAWNDEQHWAIMHFEKTAFTPEGYDLFSRQKQLSDEARTAIEQKLTELGLKDKLRPIAQ